MFRVTLLVICLAVASAFFAPAATRPSRMTMLFGGKKPAASTEYKVNQGSANKGTYIPDGVSKEQYEKVLAAEAEKAAQKKKKFFKGKNTESLTEWMVKEEKKGLSGKELNIKGHRMVKAKYDSFYTDEQSGVSW